MSGPEISELRPIYLIHGSEQFLLEQAIARLTQRFAAVADLDFNYAMFDGETATAADVLTVANTLPSLAERRLVVVQRLERMSAADLDLLAGYVEDPSPTTTLVLVATKVARNTRIFSAADAVGGISEYKAPTRQQYPRLVTEMFAERGKKIGLDGAEALVRRVGRDLRRLSVEVDKVISYTGDAAVLSRAEIEEIATSSAPASVFDMLDAVGSRDCRAALGTLARLVDNGESIGGIHAMSVRHIRKLLSARALLDRGGEGSVAGRLSTEVGVPEWQARALVTQARKFEAPELVSALRAAAAGEAQMKTSRDPRLVLELWIVGVCGASRRSQTRAS